MSVVDNIVSIKAQYGFDARVLPNYNPALPPAGNGMQVTVWSNTMIDADSDGTVGDPGDFQRVAAVRLAVVARARSVEKAGPAGCTTTPRAADRVRHGGAGRGGGGAGAGQRRRRRRQRRLEVLSLPGV